MYAACAPRYRDQWLTGRRGEPQQPHTSPGSGRSNPRSRPATWAGGRGPGNCDVQDIEAPQRRTRRRSTSAEVLASLPRGSRRASSSTAWSGSTSVGSTMARAASEGTNPSSAGLSQLGENRSPAMANGPPAVVNESSAVVNGRSTGSDGTTVS